MEKTMTKKLLIARAEEEQRVFRLFLETASEETADELGCEYVLREDILRYLYDDDLLNTAQAFALVASGRILSRITDLLLSKYEGISDKDFIRSCVIEEANNCVDRIYDLIEK